MGGVAAAGAEGAEAMFWNPAGLARLDSGAPAELALDYDALLETSYLGATAFALPMEHGVWGTGLEYFSQAPLTAYDRVGDPVGSFTPYDMAVSLSYARRLGSALLGAGVKAVLSKIDDASGATAAVDLGVEVPHASYFGDGPVDMGAALCNLGPPIKVGSASSPLPLDLRGGVLWHASPRVDAGLDLNFPADADPYAALGVEYTVKNSGLRYSLRGGYDQSRGRGIDGLTGISAGGGVDAGKFRIDYAWVPFGAVGMTHRVALLFRL